MSKDYHSEGQKDGAKGKYEPPHSSVPDLIRDIVGGQPKGYAKDIHDYKQGHANAKKQKG